MVAYLDGASLDFFYVNSSADSAMKAEVSEFSRLKEALIEHFRNSEDSQDLIQNAMSGSLRIDDLVFSLREVDHAFENAKVNEEERFGLLRISIMKKPELAH